MKQEVASTPDLKPYFTRIHHFSCQDLNQTLHPTKSSWHTRKAARVPEKWPEYTNGQKSVGAMKLIGSVEIGNSNCQSLEGLSSGTR